jgi:3-dehydroquinate dehydratase
MKRTFLSYEKPLLTCMVQADTPDRIKELVAKSLPEGAEAFGMQVCKLKPEYRCEAVYRDIFASTGDKPVYVTNYRHETNKGKDDTELAGELITLAKCGATIIDVMGDYYDYRADRYDLTDGELTMDPVAIRKQMELIENLHAVGAEVLMSSHVMKFTPAERVLEIALEHQRRGADICKIVTGAGNREEELENLRIIGLLKENLKIPFLFLSGGECRIVRRIGGILGCCMYLCVHEYDAYATKTQPLLCDMVKIRSLLG